MKRLFIMTMAFVALVIVLTGLGSAQQASAQESTIDQIIQRGQLNVGMATFVPWAMRSKSGELIGFEIDVAKALAKDLGVEVNFVPTAWDGIIPALLAGKFDVIIGGMTVTTKRNLTVNFTDAYAHSGMRLVVNKKLAEGRTKIEQFNDPAVTFSGRRGSTASAYVQKTMPKANLRLFDEDGQSLLEVVNGRAMAVFAYDPTPTIWLQRYPDVLDAPIKTIFNQGSEAFAVRRGDTHTLNVFNNWIALHWQDGFLQERNDYWFRTRDWADQVPDQ